MGLLDPPLSQNALALVGDQRYKRLSATPPLHGRQCIATRSDPYSAGLVAGVTGAGSSRTGGVMNQFTHRILANSGDISLVYGNFDGSTNATQLNPIYVRAGIVYGSTYYPVTFNGADEVKIGPNGLVASDPLPIEIAAGVTSFILSQTFVRVDAPAATTLTNATTAGSNVVMTVGSTAGLYLGQSITVDTSTNAETATITGIFSDTTLQVATLTKAHAAGVAIAGPTNQVPAGLAITNGYTYWQDTQSSGDQRGLIQTGASTANIPTYGPVGIFANTQYTPMPYVAAVGDSITHGQADSTSTINGVTAFDIFGAALRALNLQCPYILEAVPGSFINTHIANNGSGARRLIAEGATHALLLHGTNDVDFNAYTAAQIQATHTTEVAQLVARGMKVIVHTLPPNTTSTDGWVTTANQTPAATEANRVAFNTYIRNVAINLPGVIGLADFGDALETSRNSGICRCDNGNAYTTGIHPNIRGYDAMAGAIPLNLITVPGQVAPLAPYTSLFASAPVVTASPSSQTVYTGQSPTLTASATATPAPAWQWQVSTNGGSTWTNVAGATGTGATATYSPALTTAQTGIEYRCVFTNTLGSATSGTATITVTQSVAPTISTQPTSQTLTAPAAATFSIAASGTPNPAYQWQVSNNGGTSWANISGATTNALTVQTGVYPSPTGYQYRCVVTNYGGTVTSNAATLTVTAPAQTQPNAVSSATLLAWYKADALPADESATNGGALTTWNDKSGNGHSLTVPSGGFTAPVFTSALTPSGEPAVQFNLSALTDQLRSATVSSTGDPIHLLIVGRWRPGQFPSSLYNRAMVDGVNTNHALAAGVYPTAASDFSLYLTDGSNSVHSADTPHAQADINTFACIAALYASSGEVRWNGQQLSTFTFTSPVTNIGGIQFAGSAGQAAGANGAGAVDIAEAIFYSGTLSATDRQNVEHYLALKHGLSFTE